MSRFFLLGALSLLSQLAVGTISAQEEESAELFLEEYTDEFQENFFEALKQKSIQNYDKAIHLFLKCKQLDPANDVIDYQLAKAYFLDKQYDQAQTYALEALASNPTDFWYLETAVDIMDQQGTTMQILANRFSDQHPKLQENLGLIYFKRKKYKDALHVLESIKDSEFAIELTLKIKDSLEQGQKPSPKVVAKNNTANEDPTEAFKSKLEQLIEQKDYDNLELQTQEALESFPLQAYFHYAYGTALNGQSNTAKAIEVLEGALDYLFDDDLLANKIYQELAKAYTRIGNLPKANEYLNKIKSGL